MGLTTHSQTQTYTNAHVHTQSLSVTGDLQGLDGEGPRNLEYEIRSRSVGRRRLRSERGEKY